MSDKPKAKLEPQADVREDVEVIGSNKLMILAFLPSGACHQVLLNNSQRSEIGRLLLRMHQGALKISDQTLPISLGEQKK